MEKQLLFASSNKHKIAEIKALLPQSLKLISMEDIAFQDELPETADTIEGNAIQKAQTLFNAVQITCFADDTGLVIPALNGEPGVYSARYAGHQRNADDNMNLVLEKLAKSNDRKAYFKTVIAYTNSTETFLFEGRIDGEITTEKRGSQGFGYDPIFQPKGCEKTFAEMTQSEKNQMSHRSLAIEKLIQYLLESEK